jgi:hypothetical protein
MTWQQGLCSCAGQTFNANIVPWDMEMIPIQMLGLQRAIAGPDETEVPSYFIILNKYQLISTSFVWLSPFTKGYT